MHYLMPEHRVLSSLEAEAVMNKLNLTIEELPSLVHADAALEYLRRKGEETPINSVVEIIVTRSIFSSEDSSEEGRTKTKYRVIKGV